MAKVIEENTDRIMKNWYCTASADSMSRLINAAVAVVGRDYVQAQRPHSRGGRMVMQCSVEELSRIQLRAGTTLTIHSSDGPHVGFVEAVENWL